MSGADDWKFGKITDEALEVMRSRLGVLGPMSPPSDPYSRSSIIRYLAAVGDDNPLYWDEDYARSTRWGGVIAPPRMLIEGSADTPASVQQPPQVTFMAEDVLKGVFAMISGTRIIYERPIRLGDRIRSQSAPHDLIERTSRMAGKSLEQVNKTVFYNQDEEVVATVYGSIIRMEREAARANRKYLDIPPASYTADEIAALEERYANEAARERRGGRRRRWSETHVGDDLNVLAKGPLTVTEIVAYFLGSAMTYYSNRPKFMYLRANPAARLVNAETNVVDDWTAAHWDEYFARESGIPRPYDEGPMRYDYLAHLVSDWMGDDGFIRELSVQLRAPNLVGDLSECTGKVVGKSQDGERRLVDLQLWITNQRGERTTTGSATVELQD